MPPITGNPRINRAAAASESLYFLDPNGHKLEIHVGTWQSRIEVKKENIGSWKDVEWFV